MFELRCICCDAHYGNGDIEEALNMGWREVEGGWGCPQHFKGDGMQAWYREWVRRGLVGTYVEQHFFKLGYECAITPQPEVPSE